MIIENELNLKEEQTNIKKENEEEKESLITKDSIKTLFNYELKKKIEVNLNLQILSLVKVANQSEKNEVYTAVLSDSVKKYKNFVLRKQASEENFKNYQIIKILNFHSTTIKSEKFPIFIISGYKIINQAENVIGIPVSLNDLELANICIDTEKNENVNNLNKEKEAGNGHGNSIMIKKKLSNPTTIHDYEHTKYSDVKIPDPSPNEALLRTKVLKVESSGIVDSSTILPLSSLTTYTKDLCIAVRVIRITEMKSFNSQRGQGCLFSFIILDKEGTEMQVACFNKIAEKFYGKLKTMGTYLIKGGHVKINDKKFNNTKTDFKITLEEKSTIEPIEDTGEIKMYSLEVVKLEDILTIPFGSFVDSIGVVVEINDIVHKITKNGDFNMRKIYIVDDTLFKIELTLWKHNANLPLKVHDVILGKNLKVGDFNGKNLATFEDSQIILNPSGIKEIDSLKEKIKNYKGEYNTMTSTGQKVSVLSQNSEVKRLKDILDSLNKYFGSNSTGGEEQITNIKATVFNFTKSEKYIYSGCPDNNCKKKLTQSVQSKGYYCSLCNIFYDKPAYYYNISVIIKDCSADFWVDVFGGLGDKLLGIPAEEYKKIIDSGNEEKMNNLQQKVEYRTFLFQIKPKVSSFNNSLKKKLQITNIEPLEVVADFDRHMKYMDEIMN